MSRLPMLLCVAAVLGGCGTTQPTTTLVTPVPRLLVSQPLPDTRPVWQCVHRRLSRYVLDDRADASPLIVEISPWPVLIARAELPSTLTPVAEVLITEAGPKLKYVEGLRAQTLGEPMRFMMSDEEAGRFPGLSRAPAVVRLNGSLQFGETTVETAARGFNVGLFGTTRDGSGNLSSQLTTASVTLASAAVDPSTRTGGYGSASSVKVTYLRSEGTDGSFAVSFSSTALGWNNVKRFAYGPEAAVRMGMTVSMVQSLSHALRVPINECLADVSKSSDTVPLELIVEAFRARRAKDAQAAARWLNYLRAFYGAIASDPLSLRNNASSTVNAHKVALAPRSAGIPRTGLPAVLPVDEALASLFARGLLRNAIEIEFVTLYANLWRVPQATYDAGAAWVRAEQARLVAAARLEGERMLAEQARAVEQNKGISATPTVGPAPVSASHNGAKQSKNVAR